MRTFTDRQRAEAAHDEAGGYLLNLGWESDTSLDRHGAAVAERHTGARVYAVCDEAEAADMGRTPEDLEALAPSYREAA